MTDVQQGRTLPGTPAHPNFPRAPRALLTAAILAATLTAQAPVVMAAELERSYQLPAGALASTLIQYATDAGVTLHFDASMTASMTSQGLQGRYSVEDGFEQLLRDSGLETVEKSPGVYVLQPKAKASSAMQRADLDTLVINSTRTETLKADAPQVITVITREQLEQQQRITSDASQILSNLLPAFSPSRQKMTNSGETFRGRPPLFMVDGVPQSNPLRDAQRDGRTIDLAMVERIEVIHGANAVHGLGATGGIINFITRKPDSDSFTQHIEVQGNTPTDEVGSDTTGYKLNYRAEGSSKDLEYLFGATFEEQGVYLDANGQPIGVDLVQGDMMNSQGYDLFAKVGYWFDDDQHAELQLNHYRVEGGMDYVTVDGDRDAGIPTTSEKGDPEGVEPRNNVLTGSLKYRHDDFYGMALTAQAYLQQFEARFGASQSSSFQDPDIAPVGTLWDQTQNESDKLGMKLTLRKDGLLDDRLTLTGGIDLLQDTTAQTLVLTNRYYVPETVFNNQAAFIQGEFKVVPQLILHAGARYERAQLEVDSYHTVASRNGVLVGGGEPEFDDTLYNAGVVFKPLQSLSLFANYSEGFGMPDVGRVLRGINVEGLDVDSFLNLEPIVTTNREIGLRFNRGPFDGELSYYQSDSDFGTRLELIGDEYFLRRQATEVDGIHAALGYQLNDNHRLGAAWARVEGEFDSDGDGNVDTKMGALDISPDRLSLSWDARWNDQLNTFLAANHFYDRSFDNPELEFDGYTLVDLSIGYQLPQGHLNLGISNLFNEDYVTFYSQSAVAQDGRYFKGRGRLLTLSYSTQF